MSVELVLAGRSSDPAGRDGVRCSWGRGSRLWQLAVRARPQSEMDGWLNLARAAQVTQLFLTQLPADREALRLAAGFAIDAQDWRAAARLLQAVRAQVGDNDALLMAQLARWRQNRGSGARAAFELRRIWVSCGVGCMFATVSFCSGRPSLYTYPRR